MTSALRPFALLPLALATSSPNIVLFLTDDQDQMLGGSFPQHYPHMPKAQRLLADEGATATNFFVHTPICCPSRNELISGRYLHNIKMLPGWPSQPLNPRIADLSLASLPLTLLAPCCRQGDAETAPGW